MRKKIFTLLIYMLIVTTFGAYNYLDTKIVLFPIQETIVSSLVDSTIQKFNYTEGSEFKKDDVLITLDDDLYKQYHTINENNATVAQSSYEYNKDIYEHAITLFQKNAVGKQELGQFKLNMVGTLADRNITKATLDISKVKLNDCSIKAPYSGRVTKHIVNEYDYVKIGQPIMNIINDYQLLAIMHISSDKLKTIKLNDPIKVKIDETGFTYIGKIYEISGIINPNSRTFEVKAIIDNKDRVLKAGMSGICEMM